MLLSYLPLGIVCACNINLRYFNNQVIPSEKYSENYFGFKIDSSGCNKITVKKDEKDVTGSAFNEPGQYKITDGTVTKEISIKKLKENQREVLHITYHKASYSVIQAAQQLIKIHCDEIHKNEKIKMYYGRKTTLIADEVKKVFNTDFVSHEIIEADMAKEILQLYKENPKLFIIFYCEEIRASYVLYFFINNGIPSDRFHVYLNCDGTGQYAYFYDFNNKERWIKNENGFKKKLQEANQGLYEFEKDMELTDYIFQFPSLPNIHLVPHSMEYLQSDIPEVKSAMEKINIEVWDPSRDLKKLPKEQQNMYFQLTGVDADELKKKYFPKKPLMIIGTNTADYGEYFADMNEFKTFLISLITFYSNYSICFKPHPSVITNNRLSKLFLDTMRDCKISIIESQVPGEAIMSVLDDVKVGGYFSSIFLSGTPEFLFEPNLENVPAFYQPTMENLDCKYVMTESTIYKEYGSIAASVRDSTLIAIAAVVPIVVLGAVSITFIVLYCKEKRNKGSSVDVEP